MLWPEEHGMDEGTRASMVLGGRHIWMLGPARRH